MAQDRDLIWALENTVIKFQVFIISRAFEQLLALQGFGM
jgi:hypothetical protein